MTDENIKGLLAKAWKDEAIDLEPGRYFCDEVLTVRVTGTVEKKDDEFAAPTVSIPLIPTLALFWEKCGVTRDYALRMLREAITEAMLDGVKEDAHIQSHIKDVDAAIKAVRTDLIDRLPQDAAGRQGHHQGSHSHRLFCDRGDRPRRRIVRHHREGCETNTPPRNGGNHEHGWRDDLGRCRQGSGWELAAL